MPAPPGYIFRENEDGALCFEDNCPGYTMTTITWTPAADLDGAKGGSLEVPSALLDSIVNAHYAYRREKTEARKNKVEPLPANSTSA